MVVDVQNVSIRYLLGDFKDIGIKEYLVQKLTGTYEVQEFWAVKNVSFSLDKGDFLGIIGTNGAGKSTLLKAVSGIMRPQKGRIVTNGQIAALLELGTGFDGDLTIKENIYFRGALLGYTEKFMNEKYPEIIEFSELSEFENRKFRQLSSGMRSRLAFSIATVVKPDVLIVDEILSVGDSAFQHKSKNRMIELMSGGTTVLLVSHSAEQITELCSRAIWLEKGRMKMIGPAEEVCRAYEEESA